MYGEEMDNAKPSVFHDKQVIIASIENVYLDSTLQASVPYTDCLFDVLLHLLFLCAIQSRVAYLIYCFEK